MAKGWARAWVRGRLAGWTACWPAVAPGRARLPRPPSPQPPHLVEAAQIDLLLVVPHVRLPAAGVNSSPVSSQRDGEAPREPTSAANAAAPDPMIPPLFGGAAACAFACAPRPVSSTPPVLHTRCAAAADVSVGCTCGHRAAAITAGRARLRSANASAVPMVSTRTAVNAAGHGSGVFTVKCSNRSR